MNLSEIKPWRIMPLAMLRLPDGFRKEMLPTDAQTVVALCAILSVAIPIIRLTNRD